MTTMSPFGGFGGFGLGIPGFGMGFGGGGGGLFDELDSGFGKHCTCHWNYLILFLTRWWWICPDLQQLIRWDGRPSRDECPEQQLLHQDCQREEGDYQEDDG